MVKKNKIKNNVIRDVLIIYGWPIFFGIIISAILLVFIFSGKTELEIFSVNPEFKITKEVCSDELFIADCSFNYQDCTVWFELKERNDWTTEDMVEYIITLGFDKPISAYQWCVTNENLTIDEIGNIIVDKEFIDSFCKLTPSCENVEVEEIHNKCGYTENFDENIYEIKFTCGDEFSEDKEGNFFNIISKQDLTTEWLDENCGVPIARENENSYYSEYQCQSYKIEVLK